MAQTWILTGSLENFLINVEYARPVGPPSSDGRDNVVYFRVVKFFSFF